MTVTFPSLWPPPCPPWSSSVKTDTGGKTPASQTVPSPHLIAASLCSHWLGQSSSALRKELLLRMVRRLIIKIQIKYCQLLKNHFCSWKGSCHPEFFLVPEKVPEYLKRILGSWKGSRAEQSHWVSQFYYAPETFLGSWIDYRFWKIPEYLKRFLGSLTGFRVAINVPRFLSRFLGSWIGSSCWYVFEKVFGFLSRFQVP